ncbi:hypothetical protein GGI42DRAFT_126509 [Trichoderma sp. SZMC 28013]
MLCDTAGGYWDLGFMDMVELQAGSTCLTVRDWERYFEFWTRRYPCMYHDTLLLLEGLLLFWASLQGGVVVCCVFQHIYETYWCGFLFVVSFILGFDIGIGCFMGGCIIWYDMEGIGHASSHEEGNHRRKSRWIFGGILGFGGLFFAISMLICCFPIKIVLGTL